MSKFILSSVDVAILERINKLSERYGLCPCDAEAILSEDGILSFKDSIPTNRDDAQRLEAMVKAIGGDADFTVDTTDVRAFFDRIDEAIRNAPRARALR